MKNKNPSIREHVVVNNEFSIDITRGTDNRKGDILRIFLRRFSFLFRKDIDNTPEMITSRIELKAENSKPKTDVRGSLIRIKLNRIKINIGTKYLLSLLNNILY